MKKFVLLIFILSCLITLSSYAVANNYESEAKGLFTLGLYKGISQTEFIPDLESIADRQTAIVILLRLLGKEEESKVLTDEETNIILQKYLDSNLIADWAKKQIAYAIKKEIIKGYPNFLLKPDAKVTSKMYCTMILRELGYTFEYDNAIMTFAQTSGRIAPYVDAETVAFMKDGPINKDLLVGISYNSISIKYKVDGRTLLQKLIDDGKVDESKVNRSVY